MMTMIGRFRVTGITGVTMVVLSCFARATGRRSSRIRLPPVDQWKTAVLAGDAAALSTCTARPGPSGRHGKGRQRFLHRNELLDRA